MRYRLRTLLNSLCLLLAMPRRWLRLRQTDYGRDAGWVGEWEGQPVIRLSDPRFEEMFWDSYSFEIVTNDPQHCAMLKDGKFWSGDECLKLVWKSCEFGSIVPCVLPSPVAGSLSNSDRLTFRGLYLRT